MQTLLSTSCLPAGLTQHQATLTWTEHLICHQNCSSSHSSCSRHQRQNRYSSSSSSPVLASIHACHRRKCTRNRVHKQCRMHVAGFSSSSNRPCNCDTKDSTSSSLSPVQAWQHKVELYAVDLMRCQALISLEWREGCSFSSRRLLFRLESPMIRDLGWS